MSIRRAAVTRKANNSSAWSSVSTQAVPVSSWAIMERCYQAAHDGAPDDGAHRKSPIRINAFAAVLSAAEAVRQFVSRITLFVAATFRSPWRCAAAPRSRLGELRSPWRPEGRRYDD